MTATRAMPMAYPIIRALPTCCCSCIGSHLTNKEYSWGQTRHQTQMGRLFMAILNSHRTSDRSRCPTAV
jgi:hypothetical protein